MEPPSQNYRKQELYRGTSSRAEDQIEKGEIKTVKPLSRVTYLPALCMRVRASRVPEPGPSDSSGLAAWPGPCQYLPLRDWALPSSMPFGTTASRLPLRQDTGWVPSLILPAPWPQRGQPAGPDFRAIPLQVGPLVLSSRPHHPVLFWKAMAD